MTLRHKITGFDSITGSGPQWAFNLFTAKQVAEMIAERGAAATIAESTAAGAQRGTWWGAAAGAALGIGLVTWAWWRQTSSPQPDPATGDSPTSDPFKSTPLDSPTPDHLRCMDPYNTSAECAMVRSGFMTYPETKFVSDPMAARASANGRGKSGHLRESTAVSLPAPPTVTDARTGFNPTGDFWTMPIERQSAETDSARFSQSPSKHEIPWRFPQEIPICFGDSHDPRQIPKAVMAEYYRFAEENDHVPTLLLWNPETKRYELDAAIPSSLTFPPSRKLLRVHVAQKYDFYIRTLMNYQWQPIPTFELLATHRQHGIDADGPIIVDAVIYGVRVETITTPLEQPHKIVDDTAVVPYFEEWRKRSPTGETTSVGVLVLYGYLQGRGEWRIYFDLQDIFNSLRDGTPFPGRVHVGQQDYLVEDQIALGFMARRDESRMGVLIYMQFDPETVLASVPVGIF